MMELEKAELTSLYSKKRKTPDDLLAIGQGLDRRIVATRKNFGGNGHHS
jgi:hypothetical protein